MGPNGPLQSRYGRARDGQPQRFFLPDHLGTDYLAFNTRRALFAERRMRRAVNFALDRRVIARTYGSLPADHYLPPGMPGHSRTHVFPTDGPDLARARALTRGRGGTAVLYTCDVAYCKEWAQLIRRDLARIGIDVKTRHFADPVARARRTGARADMLFTKTTASWPSSYPYPVTFLANVLETPGSADRIRRAVAGYCNCGTPRDWYDNPELEARLERIGRLGGARREDAAGALDLDLARDAPGAVLATETSSSFFPSGSDARPSSRSTSGSTSPPSACARTANGQRGLRRAGSPRRAAVHRPIRRSRLDSNPPWTERPAKVFEPARLGPTRRQFRLSAPIPRHAQKDS